MEKEVPIVPIEIPEGYIECVHDERGNPAEKGERVWHSPKYHDKEYKIENE